MAENNVQLFIDKNITVFKNLSKLKKAIKDLQDKESKYKEDLEYQMDKYDVDSLDNEYIKVSRVKESSSLTVDLKKFEKLEPDEYASLLNDYPKQTNRKGYIKFTIKDVK